MIEADGSITTPLASVPAIGAAGAVRSVSVVGDGGLVVTGKNSAGGDRKLVISAPGGSTWITDKLPRARCGGPDLEQDLGSGASSVVPEGPTGTLVQLCGHNTRRVVAVVRRRNAWGAQSALQGRLRPLLPVKRITAQEHRLFANYGIGDDGSVTVAWSDQWSAEYRVGTGRRNVSAQAIMYTTLAPNATRWSVPKRVALFLNPTVMQVPDVIGLRDGAAVVWQGGTRRAGVKGLARVWSQRPLRPAIRRSPLLPGWGDSTARSARIPGTNMVVSVSSRKKGAPVLALTNATGSSWSQRSTTALSGFRYAELRPGLPGHLIVTDDRKAALLEVE